MTQGFADSRDSHQIGRDVELDRLACLGGNSTLDPGHRFDTGEGRRTQLALQWTLQRRLGLAMSWRGLRPQHTGLCNCCLQLHWFPN